MSINVDSSGKPVNPKQGTISYYIDRFTPQELYPYFETHPDSTKLWKQANLEYWKRDDVETIVLCMDIGRWYMTVNQQLSFCNGVEEQHMQKMTTFLRVLFKIKQPLTLDFFLKATNTKAFNQYIETQTYDILNVLVDAATQNSWIFHQAWLYLTPHIPSEILARVVNRLVWYTSGTNDDLIEYLYTMYFSKKNIPKLVISKIRDDECHFFAVHWFLSKTRRHRWNWKPYTGQLKQCVRELIARNTTLAHEMAWFLLSVVPDALSSKIGLGQLFHYFRPLIIRIKYLESIDSSHCRTQDEELSYLRSLDVTAMT